MYENGIDLLDPSAQIGIDTSKVGILPYYHIIDEWEKQVDLRLRKQENGNS